MTKPKASSSAIVPYTPTAREQAAYDAIAEYKRRKDSPRIKVKGPDEGVVTLSVDHEDPTSGQALLMRALGTNYEDFYRTLIDQLATFSRKGGVPDEEALNFMLTVIKGIEPRDQIEAMLASQMAAIQSLTMTMARRLATVETVPQQDSASNALNKLARTFAAQVEALKRYRTGGEQKVTVHHVSVNEGGQAIVGTVNTGGGVTKKPDSTS